MKTVKNKQLVVGADFAGYPLKEAVVAHLKKKGWEITDLGVTAPDQDKENTDLMFHRVGLRVGACISEGEFDRALLFCGTGMGIHIAASKCPHVHAGVVESVPAALRAITGNGVNVLAMGAFYVAPQMGCDIADAYLNAELGSGICIKRPVQEILSGKIGGGYRISLSRTTKLDFLVSARMTYTHPQVTYDKEVISHDMVRRNNAYASALSLGISLTF